MKVANKIFVVSIILLLSTTPIFAIAKVNENMQTSTMSNSGNYSYSLGDIYVTHYPWPVYVQNKGKLIVWYPPPGPLNFSFPEKKW